MAGPDPPRLIAKPAQDHPPSAALGVILQDTPNPLGPHQLLGSYFARPLPALLATLQALLLSKTRAGITANALGAVKPTPG